MKDYAMDTHNIITDILKHHLGGSVETGKIFGNITSAINSLKSPAKKELYHKIFTSENLNKLETKQTINSNQIEEILKLDKINNIYKKVTESKVIENKEKFIDKLKGIGISNAIQATCAIIRITPSPLSD